MGKSRRIGRRGEGRGEATATRRRGGQELTGKAGVEATGEALSTAKRMRRRGANWTRTRREPGGARGDGRGDGEATARQAWRRGGELGVTLVLAAALLGAVSRRRGV